MTIKVENLKEGYSTCNLTTGEISYLISSTGVKISPNSPIENLPSKDRKKGNTVITSLRKKGVLSSDDPPAILSGIPQAIESLADPGWMVLVRMGNWDEFTAASFFSKRSLVDHSLVGYKRNQDETLDISYFLSKEHVLSLLEPYVQLESMTMYLPQQFALSYDEYIVFFAVADAYRQASLETLLDRRIEEDWKVTEEDIDSALFKGFTFIDPRWLVSIVQVTLPFPFEWGAKRIRAGLKGLVARGLLEPVRDASAPSYTLGTDLAVFCGTILSVMGFATIQVDEILDNGKRGIFYISLLRSPNTVWVTGYNNLMSDSPEVTIFSAEGFFVSQAIAELFERSSKAVPSKPVKTRRDMMQCPSCGAALAKGSKFCSSCGQKLVKGKKIAEKKFCTECGATLKPGKKFCTNCGAKVSTS